MSAPLTAAKQQAKALLRTARLARMHVQKISEARRALSVLEAAKGRLEPRIVNATKDYAAEILGWRGYAPWLQVYSAVAGEFRPGWLPDNYYYGVVMPKVNGEYHHMARHRGANAKLFDSDAFPDLAYLVNGLVFDRDYRIIAPDRLAGFLRDRAETLVIKADRSGFGRGILFMKTQALDLDLLRSIGNGVIQARITQHEAFEQFGVPSLATLRIGTAIGEDGQPSVRTCYLKLGRAKDTHVIANNQVRVAIDWTDGSLSGEGYLSNWQPVDGHPDTQVAFAGRTVPNISGCVSTVLDLHGRLPLPRYLSWDVVVDAAGAVRVLEWEGGVVNFGEATQGPCFADLGWDQLHLR